MTSRLATAGVPGTREELSQLSLIRDYYLRFRVLIYEIGKFGVVGLVATVITFAVQNALYGHAGPTTSVVVANAIATCFAYLGNRYWAFRHRKTAKMGRETVLFVFFNLVGTVIQTAFVDFNRTQDSDGVLGPYTVAGPNWQKFIRKDTTQALVGLEVESPDPAGLAAHWAKIIEAPVGKNAAGEPTLSFVNNSFRFIKGPKEVLGGLVVKVNDVAKVREAAKARGLKVDGDSFHLCGVNFRLVA